jgi:hypothetical protein
MSVSHGFVKLPRGLERLHLAVSNAALNEGTLQQRVFDAYVSIASVDSDEVPRDKVDKLKELKKGALPDEGTVDVSSSAMSDEDARKWLRKLVELFGETAQAYGVENAG